MRLNLTVYLLIDLMRLNRNVYLLIDLMRLKKMPTRMGGKKEKKGEAFISRHAGGLSFDFNIDSNM